MDTMLFAAQQCWQGCSSRIWSHTCSHRKQARNATDAIGWQGRTAIIHDEQTPLSQQVAAHKCDALRQVPSQG
jgi:hypothetical protein